MVVKDKTVISFSPVYDNKTEENVVNNTESAAKENTEMQESVLDIAPDVRLTKSGNVEFKNANIIYQYISNNKGIKENIIFESKPENYDVSYEFELNNSYLEYSKETNQVYVRSNNDDKIVAYVSAPFLNDKTDINICYDIETKVEKKDDVWIITYKLPENYFNDKKIKYPVVLDPSVIWWSEESNIDIRETLNVGASGSSVIDSSSRFMIANLQNGNGTTGYGSQVNVRFKNLHNILKGKYISYSYLNLSKESKSGTPKFSIYPIIEDWNYLTTTWNNKPDVSSESICDMNITYDYSTIQPWITNWVRKLSSGEIDNDYGIAFYPQENSEYFYLWLYGLTAENSSTGQVRKPSLIVNYNDVENINASYDGSFTIEGEYDDENDKIDLSWETYNNDTDRYDLYVRENDNSHFKYSGCTSTNSISYSVDDTVNNYDFRVIAVNEGSIDQYGEYDTHTLSNIYSFEKSKNAYLDEQENEQTEITYEPCVKDTDGDGLEDGYEIWDFKTLWNTETSESTEQNPIYDLDSDDDGFPDDYEVFTLGTNPAVANVTGTDSDGDNWTDLKEYQEGTDPWLKDSDFDGTNDRGDATPRKTNDYTRQTRAAEATVHIGLYDKQYSETIDDVTYTYITNIYRGEIKQISADYGNSGLNKTLKYFYDEKGNNTAIVEVYDENYDPNHTQTICITYTYDEYNNATFICDQRTKYTMTYGSDNNMTSLKVGNQTLISYGDVEVIDNAGTDGDISEISIGGIIDQNEHTDTYGNGQAVRTVTTTYKVAENDTTSTASKTEVFYGNDANPTYVSLFNSDGDIKKLEDYSLDEDNPIVWNYSNTENGLTLTRSDGFTKSIQMSEDESSGVSTKTLSYGFKDIKNQNQTYTSVVESETETETNASGDDITRNVINQTLHNNDVVRIESDDEYSEEKIISDTYDDNVIKSTYEKDGNVHCTYDVDIHGNTDDENFDYTYDLAGNITEIKINNVVKYQYSYDAHGRLTDEKDYFKLKEYVYEYNTNGNVYGKIEYPINSSGNRTNNNGTTILYEYDNNNWPDQLTTYNGETITYDNAGNPLTYVGDLSFTWDRGRLLQTVTMSDDSTVSYRYNENGLRTYKDTLDATTIYEWDEITLLRETVIYKNTNQKTDVWYLYDCNGDVIGFEYSYVNFTNELVKARVYYKKNLQGDVVGLLDARGTQIATYTYDAWGNVTNSKYVEGNEIPYTLNHIGYRSYYRDQETGFYYLQSRYYDAEVGRFINADDVQQLGQTKSLIASNNLYCYCEENPSVYSNPSGKGILLLLAAVTCVAVVVAGCKKSKYTPKYNISADKMTAETPYYNCYAYALGKKKWSLVGQFSKKVIYKMDIGVLLDAVKKDLKALGYKVKTVKENYSTKNGETMFAMRSGPDDYHFMKKVGKKWKHKPGGTAILTLKGKPSDYSKWYCEFFDGNQWGIDKSIIYNSKIYYVVYSK